MKGTPERSRLAPPFVVVEPTERPRGLCKPAPNSCRRLASAKSSTLSSGDGDDSMSRVPEINGSDREAGYPQESWALRAPRHAANRCRQVAHRSPNRGSLRCPEKQREYLLPQIAAIRGTTYVEVRCRRTRPVSGADVPSCPPPCHEKSSR